MSSGAVFRCSVMQMFLQKKNKLHEGGKSPLQELYTERVCGIGERWEPSWYAILNLKSW